MKTGDYVRDKDGNIDKLIGKREQRLFKSNALTSFASVMEVNAYENNNIKKTITKSSPDIKDLIEVGDVLSFKDGSICRVIETTNNGYFLLKDFGGEQYYESGEWLNDLESIVTKEQFESMEYIV